MKTLLVIAMLLSSTIADGRGIYFQIKGESDSAETTRIVSRCDDTLTDRETKRGAKLATCRPASGGHLLGLVEGTGVRWKFFTSKDTIAWERVISGTVAFADELMLVLDAPTGYRVLWLAANDGRTVREVAFTKLSKRDIPKDDFKCGDIIDHWLRSNEKPARLAQVCTVLD